MSLDPDHENLDPDHQNLDPDHENLDPDHQNLDPADENLDPRGPRGVTANSRMYPMGKAAMTSGMNHVLR